MSVEEVRTCKMCGQTLPLDRFPKAGAYRLHTCKKCTNAQNREWYAERKEHERLSNPNIRSNNSRRCTGCGVVKMLSDFERDSLHCRACHRARRAAEYQHQ